MQGEREDRRDTCLQAARARSPATARRQCARDPVAARADGPGSVRAGAKQRGYMHGAGLGHHPLDVVGWDGYLYPWVFNVEDFEPITGRIHQPPPVHQTFEGHNFVICSFVATLYGSDFPK